MDARLNSFAFGSDAMGRVSTSATDIMTRSFVICLKKGAFFRHRKPEFSMKYAFIFLAISVLASSCTLGTYPGGGYGYPQGGNYPANGGNPSDGTYPNGGSSQPTAPSRSADKGVTVRNIRLTRDYTILDLTFTDNSQPRYDQKGNVMISQETIQIDPNANLVAANGARLFKFIRADGIPIKPQKAITKPGDVVNFTLYFERLDKGLENFDLFECNDYDYIICWNIYNLYVRNPADAVVVAPTPTPAPNPVPTPAPTKPTKPTKTKPVAGQPLPPSQAGGETAAPAPAPKPAPVPAPTLLTVAGTVSDAKNKRPISATIDYRLSSSKKAIDSVQSFASTGGYKMTLAKNQIYTYVASARGYLSASGTLDLSKAAAGQTITRDIALTPLAVGDKISLKNVYFELSKSDLLPASFAELDKLVAMMEDSPNMSIRLEGHTDIIGDHDKNLQLSQDRVAACRAYLIRQGIAASRIQAVGYGDTRPLITTGSDEDRKINRRVEFVILSL
jgi:OmpA-OmpF porin, OOP family